MTESLERLLQDSHVVAVHTSLEDASTSDERITFAATDIVRAGGHEGPIGVDDRTGRIPELEVEVGLRVLGVATVAHPGDVLTGLDPDPRTNRPLDAPSLTIVRAGGVVVQVDVPALPSLVVTDDEVSPPVGFHVFLRGPFDEPDHP